MHLSDNGWEYCISPQPDLSYDYIFFLYYQLQVKLLPWLSKFWPHRSEVHFLRNTGKCVILRNQITILTSFPFFVSNYKYNFCFVCSYGQNCSKSLTEWALWSMTFPFSISKSNTTCGLFAPTVRNSAIVNKHVPLIYALQNLDHIDHRYIFWKRLWNVWFSVTRSLFWLHSLPLFPTLNTTSGFSATVVRNSANY